MAKRHDSGNSCTARTRPVRGVPWRICPITGLSFAVTEGVVQNGKLVHPKAKDAEPPKPYKSKKNRRFRRGKDPYEADREAAPDVKDLRYTFSTRNET